MHLKILGSGAWQGVPAPFCACDICVFANKNPFTKENRMRPQLFFSSEQGSFLMEASPDIRLQSVRFELPKVQHFVISHAHFDHMRGLAELHTYMKQIENPVTVYGSERTAALIQQELAYLPLCMKVLKAFEPFSIFDFTITPLPVYHEYTRDDACAPEKIDNTFGYLVESGGQRYAYLADYYRVPEAVVGVVKDVGALVLDGTYLLTEDFREKKQNHMHGQDIFTFAESCGAKQVFYHSVSHLTGKTHSELESLLPHGHILTYDGLQIS